MGFSSSIGRHGLIYGDPAQAPGRTDHARFGLLETHDGGKTWSPAAELQPLPGESVFAASNSAMTAGGGSVWLGTSKARVLRTRDLITWQSAQTPLASGNDSSGVFSLAFRDQKHGIAVGGDYRKPEEAIGHRGLHLGWRRALEHSAKIASWVPFCRGLGRERPSLDHGGQQWVRYLLRRWCHVAMAR